MVHERHQTSRISAWRTRPRGGGLNARLFANSLDFTYYKSNTKHQTFLVPCSGRLRKHVRADGQRRKQGFRADRIRQDMEDFVSSSLTLSHNKNKVVELMNTTRPADGQIRHAQSEVASRAAPPS
ncbi:MAG: hypothetical protein ACLRMJ_05715 [Alistipes finegoldii]